MDSFQHLRIKISSSEDPQSVEVKPEKPKSERWRIKVPFPDEDKWCFVTNEAPHFFEGKVKEFCSEVDAEHYAVAQGYSEYFVEKIQ